MASLDTDRATGGREEAPPAQQGEVETDIPARMDRLPWSRWHWLVVFALGIGWRVAFGMGAVLGVAVLALRRLLPESPRWLMTHGRVDEAEHVVEDVERQVAESTGGDLPEPGDERLTVQPRDRTPMGEVFDVV